MTKTDCFVLMLMGWSLGMTSAVLQGPLATPGMLACMVFAVYGACQPALWRNRWSTQDRR